jgi:hypothetical protein
MYIPIMEYLLSMRCILARARLRVTDFIHFYKYQRGDRTNSKYSKTSQAYTDHKEETEDRKRHETHKVKIECVICDGFEVRKQKQLDLQRNVLFCK